MPGSESASFFSKSSTRFLGGREASRSVEYHFKARDISVTGWGIPNVRLQIHLSTIKPNRILLLPISI